MSFLSKVELRSDVTKILAGHDYRIGNWHIWANVDDDEHITIEIYHDDGSKVIDIEPDIEGLRSGSFISRFTTEKIEKDYASSSD